MDKRKKLIVEIILLVLLIVIVGTLIVKLIDKSEYSSSEIDDKLRVMTEDFYVNYYYDDVSKGKSKDELIKFLKQYKNTGIKINLVALSDYDPDNNDPIIAHFKKNGVECDKTGTKGVVYPKEPYDKNSFEIETIIECN